ncbi:CYTH domain-containing protein [Kamptonema cortianum]|nr:CYTH domain-containing protein [Oscillatoria laete-virens]MDK3160256.1 CYTH domain-containing protein [Kamptonema cortianum]MDL5048392.1 CYTH domain-containing protein [Oscillatoria amoena NRMC-F 0135]MDL5054243.1 CYTH domain-containing protein [Oscillatoria laete-virens NRMC-F 0139]
MPLEIERKFLVKDDSYKSAATEKLAVAQGYICSTTGRTVRVRIRGEKGFLTIKGATSASGLSRYEWEKEIAVADARDLLKLCETGLIEKIRHLVPVGRHVYEVDEFLGANAGLVVAEIELSTEEECFEKPAWLGEEVTLDRRYHNSMLAREPYTTWK